MATRWSLTYVGPSADNGNGTHRYILMLLSQKLPGASLKKCRPALSMLADVHLCVHHRVPLFWQARGDPKLARGDYDADLAALAQNHILVTEIPLQDVPKAGALGETRLLWNLATSVFKKRCGELKSVQTWRPRCFKKGAA